MVIFINIVIMIVKIVMCFVIMMAMICDDNDGRDHKKWCRYLAPFCLEKLVGSCFRGWAELSGKDIHYSNSNP